MKTFKNTLVVTLLIAMVITLVSPLAETKAAAKYTPVTVKTLSDLKKEMKKSGRATITLDLRNATEDSFTIPYIKASKNKKLIIVGKTTLKIKNKSYWKSVTVNSEIKKYTESFTKSTIKKANTITIKNSKTEFAVSKNVYVKNLTIYKANKVKCGKNAKIITIKYLDKNTVTPTVKPTTEPTKKPTQTPTKTPTQAPTQQPTVTTQPTTTQAPTTQPTVTTQPTTTQTPTTQPTVTAEPTQEPTITEDPKPTKPAADNVYWDEEAGCWVFYDDTVPIYWENGKPRIVYIKDGKYMYWSLITDEDTVISESSIDYPDNWDGNWPDWLVITSAPTPEPTLTQQPTITPVVTPEPTQEPTPEPTQEPTPEPTQEPTPEPTQEPTQAPTQQPEVHIHTWVNDTYSVPMWRAPSYHTESFNTCNYCRNVLGKSMEESACGQTIEEIDAHMKAHFDAGASTGQVSWSNGGTRCIFDEDAYIAYVPFDIKKCECGEVDYSSMKEIFSLSGYSPCVTSDQIAMAQDIYNKCGINKTPETFDSAFDGIKAILNN